MTLRKHMTIICTGVLGQEQFDSMALPQAMEATAMVFFLDNSQSVRADRIRAGLKILNETGVI